MTDIVKAEDVSHCKILSTVPSCEEASRRIHRHELCHSLKHINCIGFKWKESRKGSFLEHISQFETSWGFNNYQNFQKFNSNVGLAEIKYT